MAAGVCHGLAGAVVSSSLIISGEMSLFFFFTKIEEKLSSWLSYLVNI